MHLKIYIIEDGFNIKNHIFQITQNCNHYQSVGHSIGVEKVKREILVLKPDVIIVDIDLKDNNCFDFFDEGDFVEFKIIFLSNHDKYAIQAINMGAFGYLLKPIDKVVLNNLLDRCYREWEKHLYFKEQIGTKHNSLPAQNIGNNRRIALKNFDCIELIDIQDIIYCKSDKGYTTFYMKNKTEILVSQGLKSYENILNYLGFIRCHQSYLINVECVKKYYREGFFQMENEERIPVSSRKKEEMLKFLQSFT